MLSAPERFLKDSQASDVCQTQRSAAAKNTANADHHENVTSGLQEMKQKLSSFDSSLGCEVFCFFFPSFSLPPETHSFSFDIPASSGNRRAEESDSHARGCPPRFSWRVRRSRKVTRATGQSAFPDRVSLFRAMC